MDCDDTVVVRVRSTTILSMYFLKCTALRLELRMQSVHGHSWAALRMSLPHCADRSDRAHIEGLQRAARFSDFMESTALFVKPSRDNTTTSIFYNLQPHTRAS